MLILFLLTAIFNAFAMGARIIGWKLDRIKRLDIKTWRIPIVWNLFIFILYLIMIILFGDYDFTWRILIIIFSIRFIIWSRATKTPAPISLIILIIISILWWYKTLVFNFGFSFFFPIIFIIIFISKSFNVITFWSIYGELDIKFLFRLFLFEYTPLSLFLPIIILSILFFIFIRKHSPLFFLLFFICD